MESGSQKRRKKRPKSYYIKSAKQPRLDRCMESGLKGFLITCSTKKEKDCTREAYALLNKYADSLYGLEKPLAERKDNDNEDEDDIQAILKREIDEMSKSSRAERRFQTVNCGAKNCIFVKAQVSPENANDDVAWQTRNAKQISDPCELASAIFADVCSKGYKQQSRFILRILPILVTCRSVRDDILKAVDDLLPRYFKDTSPAGKTFAILFKCSNNNVISRTEIIPNLAARIHQLDPANKADLQSPNLAVIVNVIAKFTYLSVVPNYYGLRKYNLSELCATANSAVDKLEVRDAGEGTVGDTSESKPEVRNVSEKRVVDTSESKPEVQNLELSVERSAEDAVSALNVEARPTGAESTATNVAKSPDDLAITTVNDEA